MKKDAKLRQLIRKIVQEEVAKQNHTQLHTPQTESEQLESEQGGWGFFDEPEFRSHPIDRGSEREHHDPEWSDEPFYPHEQEYQPSPAKRRRR